MAARIFAFLIWAALAASLVFWGLRLSSQSAAVPSHAAPVENKGTARGDLARLFGAGAPAKTDEAPVTTDSRYKLLGTFAAADPEARTGWATIAIDDGPPRTYAVGTKLVGTDVYVHSVTLRGASLGPPDGDATVNLQVPLLPPAATGTLRSGLTENGGSGGAGVAPQQPLQVAPPPPGAMAPAATTMPSPETAMSLRSQIGRAMEAANVMVPVQQGEVPVQPPAASSP